MKTFQELVTHYMSMGMKKALAVSNARAATMTSVKTNQMVSVISDKGLGITKRSVGNNESAAKQSTNASLEWKPAKALTIKTKPASKGRAKEYHFKRAKAPTKHLSAFRPQ